YLCRILEAEGTCVVKVTRTSVQFGAEVWPPVALADAAAIQRLLVHFRPEEIYYLAAYHQSAEQDAGELQGLFHLSFEVHCTGYRNVLGAVATLGLPARIFYAASALVFGYPEVCPQSEITPMAPACPYGITKAAGIGIGRVYRTELGVFACAGILFNHE